MVQLHTPQTGYAVSVLAFKHNRIFKLSTL